MPRREGLEHHSLRRPHPSEAPHSDGTQRTGVGGLGPAAGHAPFCGVHALPSELDQAPGGTRFAWPQPTRRKVAPLPPPHPRRGSGHTCPASCPSARAAPPRLPPWPPALVPPLQCRPRMPRELASQAALLGCRARPDCPPTAACLLRPFLQIAYTGLPGTAVQTDEVTHSEWGPVALTSKLCRPLLELDLEYLVHLEVPVFLVKSV